MSKETLVVGTGKISLYRARKFTIAYKIFIKGLLVCNDQRQMTLSWSFLLPYHDSLISFHVASNYILRL